MGNIINLKKMMSAAMFAAGLLVSMNSAAAQQAEQEPLGRLRLQFRKSKVYGQRRTADFVCWTGRRRWQYRISYH